MQPTRTPFIIRAIWFLLVGWWLSGVFIVAGYLCIASIVFAPLGFWFLNRVGVAQTLRDRDVANVSAIDAEGAHYLRETTAQQIPWPIRVVYLPIGLIVGAAWLTVAWMLGNLIITLPISIWMINRAPAVITLQRN